MPSDPPKKQKGAPDRGVRKSAGQQTERAKHQEPEKNEAPTSFDARQLPDPSAPSPRYLDLRATLCARTYLWLEPEAEAVLEDFEVNQVSRLQPLLNVCDPAGRTTYVQTQRPLSREEADAVYAAFLIGQQLADAQVVLLSNASSEKERAHALAYVQRADRATRKHETLRWIFLAASLDAMAAEQSDSALNTPEKRRLFRFKIRFYARLGQNEADSITDEELLALFTAWHRPSATARKWPTFLAFCRRIGLEAPEQPATAKREYAEFKAGMAED